MRTIIIGDIHGCIGALDALLSRLRPGPEDRLVLLGDLFDRGSESWEVLQRVRALAADMGERFVLLRGNHEDYLLLEKPTLMQRLIWARVGRGATVRSFKRHGERMEDCASWLRERCRMYYKGEGFQCVHAGLLVKPIELNDAMTLLHDHDIVLKNRYAGPLTVVGHIALAEPTWFAGDEKTTEKLPYGTRRALPDRRAPAASRAPAPRRS